MLCIHRTYKVCIQAYNIHHERIVSARMKFKNCFITIIGVYAPEEGRNEITDEFYEQLQRAIQQVHPDDSLIIASDFNAKVGNQRAKLALLILRKQIQMEAA